MTIVRHPILFVLVVAAAFAVAVTTPRAAQQKRQAPARMPQRSAPTIEVVNIPAGSFTMGSTAEVDERPAHRVEITRPFAIGKYEVTQAQWTAVMGSNPSQFSGTTFPVERVTWAEAQMFVERLSAMTGRSYRLPTEAEWEYACRAGEAGHFSFGNNERVLARYAWFDANSREQPHAVGQREPNAWGIHDMHGNVWEWCSDWYAESYYASSQAADPQGPATGTHRTLRGGSYGSIASGCRSANRFFFSTDERYLASGLRVVLELPK
jgi:formylglycine-generating enzyme required for sulfatase activity